MESIRLALIELDDWTQGRARLINDPDKQAVSSLLLRRADVLQEAFPAYLRRDPEHLEGRWHVKTLWNLHVAEVDGERLAPDAEVADLVDRYVPGQREHYGFAIVSAERLLLSILVGHADTLRWWRRSSTDPKFRICRNPRGSNEYIFIKYVDSIYYTIFRKNCESIFLFLAYQAPRRRSWNLVSTGFGRRRPRSARSWPRALRSGRPIFAASDSRIPLVFSRPRNSPENQTFRLSMIKYSSSTFNKVWQSKTDGSYFDSLFFRFRGEAETDFVLRGFQTRPA